MRKKILAFSLALACLLNPCSVLAASESPAVLGEAAVLMDANTGEVLYEKNSHEKLYPASITKLMTTLLTVENTKMDDIVTFSHEAVYGIEPGSSHIGINEGEQLTVEECLYGVFLQSANEVSSALAEHVSGSVEAFATRMNERAAELGCTDTHFVNANGLHDPDHYTTAYDMALIARQVQTHDELLQIMGTVHYSLPPTNLQPEVRELYAQNQMIKPPSIYAYEYCLGGKNGYTTEAQNTLVTYAEKDGTRLICVVLREAGANAYVDSIALFNWGFENYQTATVFSCGDFSQSLPVRQTYQNKSVDAGEVQVAANCDLLSTLAKTASVDNIRREVSCPAYLEAPVKAGDTVGEVNLYNGDELLGTVPLTTAADVPGYTTEELAVLTRPAALTIAIMVGKTAGLIAAVAVVILFLLLWLDRHLRRKRYEESYRRRYKARYGMEPETIPPPRQKPKTVRKRRS